ncbi:MAG TPA: hypothetical protein VH370_26455, partial [Humisphaera sp.]|nr:hypothetical protein [Humisphaera sp.]
MSVLRRSAHPSPHPALSPELGLSIYLARPLQFRWRGASMHAATNDREVGNVSLGHGSDRSNAVHTL